MAGLLERVVVDGRPPRTEYRLTARGTQVASVIALLGR